MVSKTDDLSNLSPDQRYWLLFKKTTHQVLVKVVVLQHVNMCSPSGYGNTLKISLKMWSPWKLQYPLGRPSSFVMTAKRLASGNSSCSAWDVAVGGRLPNVQISLQQHVWKRNQGTRPPCLISQSAIWCVIMAEIRGHALGQQCLETTHIPWPLTCRVPGWAVGKAS